MIAVTGASGLLGASIVLQARGLGLDVTGLYHCHPVQVPGAAMRRMDLLDSAETRELLHRLKPEAIIHCAAATSVDWCEAHGVETEQVNVHASANVAEIASDLKAQLIYVSTDSVFDGREGNYSEADQPAPVNIYARSKWLGEQKVLERHPGALIARVNIYGWNAQEKLSLAEWFLRRFAEEESVPGFTDVFFCPILVNDLAGLLLQMLERGLNGLYHVTGSEKISKYEFGRSVARAFGIDPGRVVPALAVEANLKARRPLNISLSTEKIRQAMGFQMPNVEAGLRSFRALYEDGYPERIKSYLKSVVA